MSITRTFLAVLAAAVTGACSRAPSPVAPPDGAPRADVVQTTRSADSVSTELRGVHTFGSGN
ncbi:MAG: hypothetical protein ABW277_18210 [Longimicrobiaceae bacterium]